MLLPRVVFPQQSQAEGSVVQRGQATSGACTRIWQRHPHGAGFVGRKAGTVRGSGLKVLESC